MTTQATQWTIRVSPTDPYAWDIISGDRVISSDLGLDKALKIVHCVNNFDDLLAALMQP